MEGAADADAFMDFMLNTVLKLVRPGDYVIGDGARIHTGWTADVLTDVFAAHGVRYITLPAYSCELNPIEMVFAIVKIALKGHDPDEGMLRIIAEAFNTVDLGQIMELYKHSGYSNFGV